MLTIENTITCVNTSTRNIGRNIFIPLQKGLGRELAEDVFSMVSIPSFQQPSVDRYVINEVKPDDHHQPTIKPVEADRIFTGAPVPDTTNSIIIQEHVTTPKAQLITKKQYQQPPVLYLWENRLKKGDIVEMQKHKL